MKDNIRKQCKLKLPVVLASGSPRRKELLRMIFEEFETIVSDCKEVVTSRVPEMVTEELARQKAEAVAESGRVKGAAVVIGADTVVSINGEILGKPHDRNEAHRMLHKLSGKSHKVSTGVALLQLNEEGGIVNIRSFSETTLVKVAELTEEEISAYLDTDDPYDKAGAYGIQGLFGKYIEGIEGDYNNVVGLPVHRLYVEMRNL